MNRWLLLAWPLTWLCLDRPANAQGAESAASARATGAKLQAASAARGDQWEDPTRPPLAVRRSGFTAGLSLGLSLGRGYGYPNEAEKIDRAAYRSDTHFGLGSANALWLGGALTDWFTVGIGMFGVSLVGNDITAAASGFIFHIETFPLFYAGKAGQNLGVLANFGAGTAQLLKDKDKRGDGGSMSCVGAGLFYEPLRFWHFSAGPSLETTYFFSRSARHFSLTGGFRLVFYGGP